MSQRFIELIATLDADTASLDSKVKRSGQAVTEYGGKARRTERHNRKLGDSFKHAARSVQLLPGPLGGAASQMGLLLDSVSGVGVAFSGATIGATAFVGAIAAGLPVLAETERRMLQQEQLLKATHHASGYTAEQLDTLARKVASATLTNTEHASKAIAVMLTFRSVMNDQNNTFERAIYLAQSMASVFGGDITSSAKQLGRALELPSEGMTALRRSGVTFTESQREMVAAMEEAGDVAGAQALILAELEAQLGTGSGAGGAEAQGLVGAVDSFTQSWDEMLESLADKSGAMVFATTTLKGFSEIFNDIRAVVDPEPLKEFNALLQERMDLDKRIKAMGDPDALPAINPFGESKNSWFNAQVRYGEVTRRLRQLQDNAKQASILSAKAQEQARQAADQRAQSREKARQKAAQDAASVRAAQEANQEATRQKRLEESDKRERARAEQQADDWLVTLSRRNLSEMALLNAQYMDEAVLLQRQRQDRLIGVREFNIALEDIQTYYADKRLALIKRQHEEQEKAQQGFWDRYTESMQETAFQTDELWRQTFDGFTTHFGQAFASVIMQSESLGDAFKAMAQGLAQSMLSAIGKIMAQRLVLWTLEKTMFAKGVSSQVAQVSAEAHSASKVAAINAYKSTAAIPYTGPLMAPAAAVAATAFTEPLAIAATAAAGGLAGMAHDGISAIPKDGTWLLEKGERVYSHPAADKLDRMYELLESGRRGSTGVNDIHLNVTIPSESHLDLEAIHTLTGQFRHVVKEELLENLRPGGLLDASI